MIDRQRVSPLYLQIKKQIIADIESHKYPEGSQIPSEGELEQKYGVSRITVRRAVSELVTENFFWSRNKGVERTCSSQGWFVTYCP